jgi:hypothetical protein
MKRILVTLVVFVLCLVPLRADLTFTQTMTMEGPMAAATAGKPMVVVTRIKGKKARTDMDVMDTKMSTLTDLATKEILLINHKERTVQALNPTTPAAADMPKMDIAITFKATGQSKPIDGVACDEHAFKMSFGFAEMSGKQMPPEAAEMMKDVRMLMDGSIWIAKGGPGAAEYVAFQKAAVDANLASALAGLLGGGQQARGGMDKLMAAVSEAPGLPYLTEISMSVEGTGPMVEMMKTQMTGMRLIQKTTAVTTDAVSDDLFNVPADYTRK